jgi:sugar/nucleoside kinase (ribokinase family)
VVVVDRDGERSFCYRPGASESINDVDLANSGWEKAPAGSVLHLCTPSKLIQLNLRALLGEAKRKNLVTTMDLDVDVNEDWVKTVWAALPYTDILMCNLGEGKTLVRKNTPGEIGQAVLKRGVNKLVLKLGSRGSMLITAAGAVAVPGHKVRAVDGTGAGDLFVSGFLAWTLNEGLLGRPVWSKTEIEEALEFANLCGATCATQVGASLGSETFETLKKLKKQVYGKHENKRSKP